MHPEDAGKNNPLHILPKTFGSSIESFLANKADFFSGMEVTKSSYYGYAGTTWAFGKGLDQPGYRLRLSGGTGRYTYESELTISGNRLPVNFSGEVSSFDVLAGYQYHHEHWVIKAFLGMNYTEHNIGPYDPDNDVQGTAYGAKTQLELWWTIDDQQWLSADATYATSFGDFWSQARYGYTFEDWIAIGPEITAFGHQDYETGRAGVFTRFYTDYGDITLSGGVTGNFEEDASPYGALSIYQKF
ncbi:MAG: cellulose biosynthesis protein BcsS [Pseudomonadota bacterium]